MREDDMIGEMEIAPEKPKKAGKIPFLIEIYEILQITIQNYLDVVCETILTQGNAFDLLFEYCLKVNSYLFLLMKKVEDLCWNNVRVRKHIEGIYRYDEQLI